MGTSFSAGLNGVGFFSWVEWGRLFRLIWLGTAFSAGLAEDGFLSGLNGNGFFIWVEWERLFHLG
jgi:hypothetical protein